jgi:hypothetical protein
MTWLRLKQLRLAGPCKMVIKHGILGHLIFKLFSDTSTTGWWFGTFFMFSYIGNYHPN